MAMQALETAQQFSKQVVTQSLFRPLFLATAAAVFSLSCDFGFFTLCSLESAVFAASTFVLLTALAPPAAVKGMDLQLQTS